MNVPEDVRDILYTPLDCPPMPDFDLNKFVAWAARAQEQGRAIREAYTQKTVTAEFLMGAAYPWVVTPIMNNDGRLNPWEFSFDEEFPELSRFFLEAFDLPQDMVEGILALPTKDGYVGPGFWHQDNNVLGLRMYLEFEHLGENRLLFKRTKEQLNESVRVTRPDLVEQLTQPEIIEASILHPRQCFFINNMRAFHTIDVNRPGRRIVVTIKHKQDEASRQRVVELVKRSAARFAEHAIFWQPPAERV